MDTDSDQKRATATSFGDSADGYLSSKTHSEGDDLELLASWCDEATWALDVATGAGHTAGALIDAGVPNVVASDASSSMVSTSIESFPGAKGVVVDAERLPFATNTFDAVTCRIAAHHFPDPEAFVAEVGRVVRPGGIFALEDNVAPEDDSLNAFINELETMRDPTHVKSYRTSTWHQSLSNAGFSIEKIEHLMKTIDFGPWIDRIGALDPEDKEEVHQLLLNASKDAVDFFEIQYHDGDVQSFESLKAMICAVREGENSH